MTTRAMRPAARDGSVTKTSKIWRTPVRVSVLRLARAEGMAGCVGCGGVETSCFECFDATRVEREGANCGGTKRDSSLARRLVW